MRFLIENEDERTLASFKRDPYTDKRVPVWGGKRLAIYTSADAAERVAADVGGMVIPVHADDLREVRL